MKKLLIAMTALAGITFLSGCAWDYYPYGHYAYGYGYHPFYGYGYHPGPVVGFSSGLGWDCVHHWNATYCRT